jgi:transposase
MLRLSLGGIISHRIQFTLGEGKLRKLVQLTPLPADDAKRIKELEARLAKISTENDRLKRIVAEKELQITIMEEVRDLKNPR